MEAFGIPEEMREKIEASARDREIPDDFIVMEENWPALEVFLTCQTQWRYSMSGPIGIDYTSLLSVISLYSAKKKRQLFDEVRLIELGALNAISEMRKRDG